MYVLIPRDPNYSPRVYGPFQTPEAAAIYAENLSTDPEGDWMVLEVSQPEARA